MRLHRVDRSDLLLALRLVGLLVVRGRIDKRIDGLRHNLLPGLLQAPDKAVLGRLVLLSQPFLLMSVRLIQGDDQMRQDRAYEKVGWPGLTGGSSW